MLRFLAFVAFAVLTATSGANGEFSVFLKKIKIMHIFSEPVN